MTSDERALLSEHEVARLLLAASERAPTGVRNRAMIALLYCAGVRLEEALALRRQDVDLEGGALVVRGRRARTAHLFASAAPYLEAWLAVRAELDLGARAPLLCTLRGEPLEPAYVRAMLARLGRRAVLRKRVHAHGLRHAFTVRAARAGADRGELARQLGHGGARSLARVLRAHGIARAAEGGTPMATLSWSIAPASGSVRAIVRITARERATAALASATAAAAGVLVRRWRPDAL